MTNTILLDIIIAKIVCVMKNNDNIEIIHGTDAYETFKYSIGVIDNRRNRNIGEKKAIFSQEKFRKRSTSG